MEDCAALIDAMTELNEDLVMTHIRTMLDSGYACSDIQMGLNIGVTNVGKRFENGEYFIADLIVSGMIYRDALGLMMPAVRNGNAMPVGRVVIGVVEGDIHDIGKDIIVNLLRAERFEVIDLGIDVKPDRFAYAIRTYRPDVLLMSGVLSFAKESMQKTMELLEKEGLRNQIPVLIGGLCASEYQMKLIGADGWAYDTKDTVDFCKRMVNRKYDKES